MRTSILILLGFLVLCMAGFYLLSSSNNPKPPPQMELGVEGKSRAAADEAYTPAPLEPTPKIILRGEALADDSAHAISVIDAETDQLIPGAEIFVVDLPEESRSRWLYRKEPTRECLEMVINEGLRSISNPLGQAWIAQPTGLGIVVARTASHFGVELLNEKEQPWQVKLRPDPSWTVSVKDSRGEPLVDLPMRLMGVSKKEGGKYEYERINTDDEGKIQLFHLNTLMARWKRTQLFIEPVALLREPVSIPFDPNNPQPLTMNLPNLGKTEVKLKMVNGEPLQQYPLRNVRVIIHLEGRQETHGGLVIRPDASEHYTAFVETFQTVYGALKLRGHGENKAAAEGTGPGPTRPGEKTDLHLQVTGKALFLRMRIMQAPDNPVANNTIHIWQRTLNYQGYGSRTNRTPREVTTNASGVLFVPSKRPKNEQVSTLTLRVPSIPGREAITRIPLNPTRSLIDLGDIWLEEMPILLAGRIVTPEGKPFASAALEIQCQPIEEDRPTLDARVREHIQVHGSNSIDHLREAWERDSLDNSYKLGPDFKLKPDESGRFSVTSAERIASVRARASYGGKVAGDWQVFPPGTRGVEITLESPASLSGSILLPKGLPSSRLGLSIKRSGKKSSESTRALKMTQEGDVAYWNAHKLLPGTWTISITLLNTFSWTPLVTPIKVTLTAGEKHELPPINLADKVSLVRVSVLDESNAPVKGTLGTHNYPDSADINVTDGKASFLVRKQTDTAWFGAKGYLAQSLKNPKDGDSVILKKGFQVRIRLTNPEVLYATDLPLTAQLNGWVGDNWVRHQILQGTRGEFDENGEVTVTTSKHGALSLSMTLGKKSKVKCTTEELHIKEQNTVQEFSVTLDPQSTQELILKLNDR
jgi:hypothetical protein